ncbi:MAG TPA: hypothetical protein VIY73_09850 [Polyangiaceae bacterium]
MLFGRLRVPLDREPALRDGREDSGIHVVAPARGETPRRQLFIVEPTGEPKADDLYAGLDRLDREELDEE